MSFEISKENLYDLYINKNLTAYEIADKFDVSEQVVRKKIKKYEIKKDKELLYKKIKEIVSQKYGVENISQLDLVKKKNIKIILFLKSKK